MYIWVNVPYSLFSEVFLALHWPSWHTSQQKELGIERQKKKTSVGKGLDRSTRDRRQDLCFARTYLTCLESCDTKKGDDFNRSNHQFLFSHFKLCNWSSTQNFPRSEKSRAGCSHQKLLWRSSAHKSQQLLYFSVHQSSETVPYVSFPLRC